MKGIFVIGDLGEKLEKKKKEWMNVLGAFYIPRILLRINMKKLSILPPYKVS
jgi:hypothetical protein